MKDLPTGELDSLIESLRGARIGVQIPLTTGELKKRSFRKVAHPRCGRIPNLLRFPARGDVANTRLSSGTTTMSSSETVETGEATESTPSQPLRLGGVAPIDLSSSDHKSPCFERLCFSTRNANSSTNSSRILQYLVDD